MLIEITCKLNKEKSYKIIKLKDKRDIIFINTFLKLKYN